MRTEVTVFAHFFDDRDEAERFLARVACGPDVADIEEDPDMSGAMKAFMKVTLDETDQRLPDLIHLLKKHDLRWWTGRTDRYTEEELDSARLLFVYPGDDCEIDVWVSSMKYNWSRACQMCGNGARQISAMTVAGETPSGLLGQRAFLTNQGHLLVDEGLAAMLEQSRATGLSFRDVYQRTPEGRRLVTRWKQVCAARTLPPVSPRTTGLTRKGACEVCRRMWYFERDEPARIVYRASDLRDADDVNMSLEHRGFCGGGLTLRDARIYSPWTLVTPKIRRVFRDAGVTSFDWLPVRVEEDSR